MSTITVCGPFYGGQMSQLADYVADCFPYAWGNIRAVPHASPDDHSACEIVLWFDTSSCVVSARFENAPRISIYAPNDYNLLRELQHAILAHGGVSLVGATIDTKES